MANAEAKDRLGVLFAVFSAELIETCLAHNVFFALENPQTSRLWHFPPMQRALSDSRVNQVTFHACAFGAANKKPTTLAGTLPGLRELVRNCPGKSDEHIHDPLSGCTRAAFHGKTLWVSKTLLGGAYTKELCAEISRLIKQAASMRRIPRLAEAPCAGRGAFEASRLLLTMQHIITYH